MNILFTICGRAGSKGVKNKNLKDFLGVPLVFYTLASMKMALKKLEQDVNYRIVLNTDSEDLIKLVTSQKTCEVSVIRRVSSLGGDTVPKVSVIRDCLVRSEADFGEKYDMVVDLDITSPLRTAEDVVAAIEKKLSRTDTDVVYSVTNARRNPYFNMVREENGYFVKAVAANFTSRQQAPVFYDMNASIYAYSCKALMEKEPATFFNDRAAAIMMKDTAVLDIDSEEDFELMEVVAKYLFERYEDLAQIRAEAERMTRV